MGRRLHLVPRFRQKLAFVPFGQGRPVWVDDPHFNLEYHVRHTALPEPGDEEQLKRLAGRIMSQASTGRSRCGRSGSIDKLAGNRFAMIAKTHHCLVDGVSGADLTAVLLDLTPEPPQLDASTWKPKREPSAASCSPKRSASARRSRSRSRAALRAALRAPRRVLKRGPNASKASVRSRGPV